MCYKSLHIAPVGARTKAKALPSMFYNESSLEVNDSMSLSLGLTQLRVTQLVNLIAAACIPLDFLCRSLNAVRPNCIAAQAYRNTGTQRLSCRDPKNRRVISKVFADPKAKLLAFGAAVRLRPFKPVLILGQDPDVCACLAVAKSSFAKPG